MLAAKALAIQRAPGPEPPRRKPSRVYEKLDNGALLTTVIDGEEVAWRVFYRRFRGLILSCAMKTAVESGHPLPPDDLMDVVGETALRLINHNFRRLRMYRPERGTSVASWIGLITVTTTRDYIRRQRRNRSEPTAEEELERVRCEQPGPDDMLAARERQVQLNEIAQQLSPRDQEFVRLYFSEALEPDVIADQMGISVATVYSKKAKIRARLCQFAAQTETGGLT